MKTQSYFFTQREKRQAKKLDPDSSQAKSWIEKNIGNLKLCYWESWVCYKLNKMDLNSFQVNFYSIQSAHWLNMRRGFRIDNDVFPTP